MSLQDARGRRLTEILFEYEPEAIRYYTRNVGLIHTKYTKCSGSNDFDECYLDYLNDEYYSSYVPDWEMNPEAANFSNTYIEISGKHLSKIIYKNREDVLRLDFLTSEREDIIGGKRLIKINFTDLRNNRVLFSWVFENDSYFVSNVENYEHHPSGLSSPLHKRLKLKKIHKSDIIGNTTFPHVFSYYGESTSEQHLRLPPRNSYAGVDHWGYANSDPTLVDVLDARKSFPVGVSYFNELHINFPWSDGGSGTTVYRSGYAPHFSFGSDKSIDTAHVKSNAIKKIEYPTGGYTLFYYEPNTYSQIINNTVAENTKGGGIRIKKMIDKADGYSEPIVRKFNYHTGGVVFSIPEYLSQVFIYSGANASGIRTNLYNLHNSPINPLFSYGDIIGYNKVTEETSNGFVDYYYHTANEDITSYTDMYARINVIDPDDLSVTPPYINHKLIKPSHFPVVRQFANGYYGKSFTRGLLRLKTVRNNMSDIVYEEEYIYDNILSDKVFGNKFIYKNNWSMLYYQDDPYYSSKRAFYILNVYFHQTGKSFLSKKITRNYDQFSGNVITKTGNYQYDQSTELLTEIEETNSANNDFKFTRISYPFNYEQDYSGILLYLTDHHMFDFPVEIISGMHDGVKQNEVVTHASYNKYGYFGQFIKPAEIFSLEAAVPLSNFAYSTQLASGQFDQHYNQDDKIVQVFCENKGNLKELQQQSSVPIAFLWGYNHNLLIAKIENASYDLVESELTALGHSIASLQNKTDSQLVGIFQNLRNRPAMKNAMITSYTHKTLVGITSQTDPVSLTTYYEYDTFGRLKYTKNDQMHYLNKYDYHYRTEE